MAKTDKVEEKKTTTTAKKTSSKKTTTKKADETQEALDKALALITEMQKEMAELKSHDNTTIIHTNDEKRRKIKCISLSHHPVNVSTMPNLNGKIYQFVNYGQIIQIGYDDLLEVIASYPNTMASGLVYICDKDIIEDNGLTEAYKSVYDKDVMDRVVYLREESDAELILGMNDDLKESALIEVVRLYKTGERMSSAALAVLKEHDIDIIELAKESVV